MDDRQGQAWQRARGALIEYERENGLTRSGRTGLLADLLALGAGPTLEVEIAVAARRAGVHIRTGCLRDEQKLFAKAGVRGGT